MGTKAVEHKKIYKNQESSPYHSNLHKLSYSIQVVLLRRFFSSFLVLFAFFKLAQYNNYK